MFVVSIPRDATEVQVQVTGLGGELPPTTFLDVSELAHSPKSLRLTDIVYAIEGGCVVYLWWEDATGDTLILPLEGRGRLDLTPIGGISNPRNEGWTGHVRISTSHSPILDGEVPQRSFFLGLEFMKLTA